MEERVYEWVQRNKNPSWNRILTSVSKYGRGTAEHSHIKLQTGTKIIN